MSDAMATGRMSAEKKAAGNAVLRQNGLSASAAINLLYDRLISERNIGFLKQDEKERREEWAKALAFVDSLSEERSSRFDSMSKAEIRTERLKKRGLM